MKLFVNEKIITTEDQPLVIILTKKDIKNIANMAEGATIYCQYQIENHTFEEIDKLTDKAKEKGS